MTDSWIHFLATLLVALLVAVAVTSAAAWLTGRLGRGWPPAGRLATTARGPLRVLLVSIAVWTSTEQGLPVEPTAGGVPEGVADVVLVGLRVLTIVALAWLVTAMLLFFEERALARNDVEKADNRHARRVRTQMLIIRRLTVGLVALVALGAILTSIPGVSAVGASLLASAGIVSVIAGLAAQSTLGNVIAGVQIAFNDSIRFDDAVIVEEEWGWIEEITLTYVVVRLWDDRRLVLPSTYFTTTPFQNWTRTHSELLGTVDFDLDWRVDTQGLRDVVTRTLESSSRWDGRVNHLQVTDAVNGWVHVRALVTARDAPTLFDLRCEVREAVVVWLRTEDPDGLPRLRTLSA